MALSEPSFLSLCLVASLCFQICAAGVSKSIKLLFRFGFNTLHACVAPHDVSDMAELALSGVGTNPLLLSHAKSHFLTLYAA